MSSKTEKVKTLTAFAEDGETLNAIIETPKGRSNKFKFDEKTGLFKLGKVLPAGAVFPFDFGFVPSTLGEDGDALDVLVLMDEPAFPGCLVEARLVGVIEAEQTEQDGKKERNDRLIAVAQNANAYKSVKQITDLSEDLINEIEHFFVSYNQIEGREFKLLRRRNASAARRLVKEGMKRKKDSNQ
jgi:inorganic pyrophosphatase